MPFKSQAQARLMQGIANGTYPSGYRGISKKVADDFVRDSKEQDIKKLAEHVKPERPT